ncbi:hypothetical protein HMPREF0973_02942 [Prevotella veroralis F0319]|uniref:Uncharacterized protein n=1 Tax=Prevotella veroralis F0319 TaxID=649761 RepID=C9MTG6_9BACT|nr:hypothetical protein HMPREF0973_02942 [Prevotella veroralis F0319]
MLGFGKSAAHRCPIYIRCNSCDAAKLLKYRYKSNIYNVL